MGPLQYFISSSLKILVNGWIPGWIFTFRARFPHWCKSLWLCCSCGKGSPAQGEDWPRVIHSQRMLSWAKVEGWWQERSGLIYDLCVRWGEMSKLQFSMALHSLVLTLAGLKWQTTCGCSTAVSWLRTFCSLHFCLFFQQPLLMKLLNILSRRWGNSIFKLSTDSFKWA